MSFLKDSQGLSDMSSVLAHLNMHQLLFLKFMLWMLCTCDLQHAPKCEFDGFAKQG